MKMRLDALKYGYFDSSRRIMTLAELFPTVPTGIGGYPRGWFSAKMAIRSSSKAYW